MPLGFATCPGGTSITPVRVGCPEKSVCVRRYSVRVSKNAWFRKSPADQRSRGACGTYRAGSAVVGADGFSSTLSHAEAMLALGVDGGAAFGACCALTATGTSTRTQTFTSLFESLENVRTIPLCSSQKSRKQHSVFLLMPFSHDSCPGATGVAPCLNTNHPD